MIPDEKNWSGSSTTNNVTYARFGQPQNLDSTITKRVHETHYENYAEILEFIYSYYMPDNNKIGNNKIVGNESVNSKFNKNGGGEMSDVNWQEKYLDSLDKSIKEIKDGLVNTENRISDTINKHIEYSTHLDKQRHDELLNLNNKIDDSVDKINDKIDNTNKWIIGLVITTILSIAAMVLTVILT